jgi:hypothetical protein
LETERRLSSSSCSGAASGWSREPRGTMPNGPMELQFCSRRSITDQQRPAFQVPRFSSKTTLNRAKAMAVCTRSTPFWAGKVAVYLVTVRKWTNKCQSLPYDEATPVENGLTRMQRASGKPEQLASVERLLYLFSSLYSASDFHGPFKVCTLLKTRGGAREE